jgi:serine/threonine protein phosphatase PrpC
MYQLDIAAQVDRGLVRETNQDVARIAPPLGLVVVADGMGGHERGEVASSVAADTILSMFERLGGQDARPEETARRLVCAFEAANVSVRAQPSSSRSARMGTTLVAAALGHSRAVIAHVGDSRCYLVRHGSAECLTQDHSYAAELRRQGLDGNPDLRSVAEQYQNMLTRCIGGAEEVIVDANVVGIQPGDVLVLCSDGLWGGVGPEAISHIVQAAPSAEDACRALISAAWQSGGLDNIGVAVVRVLPLALREELPPEREATTPASP